MVRNDPNTWTKDFVKDNKLFCFDFLAETNQIVIKCIKNREFTGAVAGMDRIINGLIIIHDSGTVNCKQLVSDFSRRNGDVLLFSLAAVNETKMRASALANYEDAYDFSRSESVRSELRPLISDIKSGLSVSTLKSRYASDYPSGTVKALEELTTFLLSYGSGKLSGRPVEEEYFATRAYSQSSAQPKTFREKLKTIKSCLTAIIVVWIGGGLLLSAFMNRDSKMPNYFDPERTAVASTTTTTAAAVVTPAESTTNTQNVQTEKTGVVIPEEGLNLRQEPDINGEWIDTMSQGEIVPVLKTGNGWAYVNYNGVYGWCSMEYLEIKD